jgi:hypothetical protein
METISSFEREQTFIVELTFHEIEAIGKALHILTHSVPDQFEAESALKSLAFQTTAVREDPRAHGVYPDRLKAPKAARQCKLVPFLIG